MLYDGDCGICNYFIQRIKKTDHKQKFNMIPYQHFPEEKLLEYGLNHEKCSKKIYSFPHKKYFSSKGKIKRVRGGVFCINHFFMYYFPYSMIVIFIYSFPILLLFEMLIYFIITKQRYRLSYWFGLKKCQNNSN